MIDIQFYFKDQDLFRFRVSGHANYSKSGSDIVCAGVSALVINTINSITTLLNEPMIINEKNEKKGVIDCIFPNVKNGIYNAQTEILLKSLILGVEEIKKAYPNNIRIKKYESRR